MWPRWLLLFSLLLAYTSAAMTTADKDGSHGDEAADDVIEFEASPFSPAREKRAFRIRKVVRNVKKTATKAVKGVGKAIVKVKKGTGKIVTKAKKKLVTYAVKKLGKFALKKFGPKLRDGISKFVSKVGTSVQSGLGNLARTVAKGLNAEGVRKVTHVLGKVVNVVGGLCCTAGMAFPMVGGPCCVASNVVKKVLAGVKTVQSVAKFLNRTSRTKRSGIDEWRFHGHPLHRWHFRKPRDGALLSLARDSDHLHNAICSMHSLDSVCFGAGHQLNSYHYPPNTVAMTPRWPQYPIITSSDEHDFAPSDGDARFCGSCSLSGCPSTYYYDHGYLARSGMDVCRFSKPPATRLACERLQALLLRELSEATMTATSSLLLALRHQLPARQSSEWMRALAQLRRRR